MEEKVALKRWMYRGGRPNKLTRLINAGWAMIHALGIFPNYLVTLDVVGRQSGKTISFPLALTIVNGERYLVSMLGEETNWVRNVRAAGGKAGLRHGMSEQVLLEEVEIGERAPILKAFLRHAPGARPHIPVDKDAPVSEFETIASKYPVFKLETISQETPGAGGTGALVQGKNENVLIFIAVVFALSIPFWILDAVYPIELLPGLPLSALGALAPMLAAAILVAKNDRLAGALRLLRRSFDFKRIENKGWLLPILLINPAIAVLAFAAMRAGGVAIPDPAPPSPAVLPLFLFFFIGGLAEEIGWTGYATEPLLRRRGTAMTGVLLGLVWAIWHFIPLIQAHRAVEWIAWWSLGTLSLRLIMTWLYTRSGGSVFAAALFHALTNLCWQLFPIDGSYYDPRVFGLITLGVAAALFAAGRLLAKSHPHAA